MGTRPEATIVPSPRPRSARRTPRDHAARALVLGLLGRLRSGAVIVREGGRRHLVGRPIAGERIPEIEVLDPAVWRAVATEGSSGLGRAWFSGYWRCADLDDLTMFLRIVTRNLDALERAGALARRLGAPVARLREEGRPGDPAVDRRNVSAHYDLGNEFFAGFLDETMTYSSAIFASPETALADAQRAKLDRICRKLAIGPSDHVLEIGTGWGSFAIHAASAYGCRVTTTTISARQHELASRRVKEAGLEDLVTVLERDYRELSGTYDKLVSIEMIEALDWRQYDTFFSACGALVKPEGIAAIQAIVIADQYYERAKRTEDFIKRYVFPGSCLPSITTIVEGAARAGGLRLVGLDDIGEHYVETLRRWRHALPDAARAAGEAEDAALVKLFEFYLCYCEAGFAERRISDVQCFFANRQWRRRGLADPGR